MNTLQLGCDSFIPTWCWFAWLWQQNNMTLVVV